MKTVENFISWMGSYFLETGYVFQKYLFVNNCSMKYMHEGFLHTLVETRPLLYLRKGFIGPSMRGGG